MDERERPGVERKALGARPYSWLGAAIAGTLAVGGARRHAQPAEPSTAAPAENTRPWAAGVSEAEQAIALELYRAGNLEFAESRFAQALARYREAIRHRDHPAIRFNMAVCLGHGRVRARHDGDPGLGA